MKKTNQEKSFTLLEAIVAIFVITTGVIGVYSLIIQTLSASNASKEKLIAAYLAQEGIEIVRNIRDTNWVEGPSTPWDDGLVADSYQADYLSTSLSQYEATDSLDIGPYGYYYYPVLPSNPTKFQREIIISAPNTLECPAGDCLLVKVKVYWGTNTVTVQEHLYFWYQ